MRAATFLAAMLPRDLVDEIERELTAARVAVSADRARIDALEELQVRRRLLALLR